MRCTAVPGGGFICGGRPPRRRCSTPGCDRWAEAQCDYPVRRKGKLGTCDAHLYERCRQHQGEDRDFCIPHQKTAKIAVNPSRLTAAPSPGDCFVHIASGTILYVHGVGEHGGTHHVTYSRTAPDAGGCCSGVLETATLAKWNERTKEL